MARDLWARVDRPNVMIKIPGTPEGVPAIRAAIADGININVTLLFSLDAWAAIAEAWLAGLEDRAAAGKPVDGVASVASFFVSRVDTAVDKRLKALGSSGAAAARPRSRTRSSPTSAGSSWSPASASPRCARRARARSACCGPRPARRTPRTPTSKYVAELVGPETVNTMPLATLLAYQDHGEPAEPLLPDAAPAAHAAIAAVEAAGVSLDEVTDELLEAGIVQFANAMDTLLAASSAAARPCSPASRRASRRA